MPLQSFQWSKVVTPIINKPTRKGKISWKKVGSSLTHSIANEDVGFGFCINELRQYYAEHTSTKVQREKSEDELKLYRFHEKTHEEQKDDIWMRFRQFNFIFVLSSFPFFFSNGSHSISSNIFIIELGLNSGLNFTLLRCLVETCSATSISRNCTIIWTKCNFTCLAK